MIDRSTSIRSALRARQRGFLMNPFRFNSADPHYANVSLLLHFDGANGSTTFTDSSPSPKTVTRVGSGVISTAQSLFGGASYAGGNNSSNYLTIPSSSAFDFTAGDFCFETAVYLNSVGGSLGTIIWTKSEDTGFTPFNVGITADQKVRFRAYSTTPALVVELTSTASIALNAWQRISFTRSGTTFRAFLEGVQFGTATGVAASLYTSASLVSIGNFQPTAETRFKLDGYLDEMRITKGAARYTADYTLAAAAFPNF